MGRLSDFVNSGGVSSGNIGGVDVVTLEGFPEVEKMLEHLLMSDYDNARRVRGFIRKVLKEARTAISKDIRSDLPNDPRKAYKAVKTSVYKQLFGGNISILQKRKAGSPTKYSKPRTLMPGQRGGNRIHVDPTGRTAQLDSYGGSDRGFVLRFQNSGTSARKSKYGNRGSITGRGMFSRSAPRRMEEAAEKLTRLITEYIKEEANG